MAKKKRPPAPQSGITNRPPEHALVAAIAFAGDAASTPATARTAIENLREVVRRELRSDLDDQDATTLKEQPGPETGELGFRDGYDRAHLTITFGIGKTGFDSLGVPAEIQPQDLTVIDWNKLADSPALSDQQGVPCQLSRTVAGSDSA